MTGKYQHTRLTQQVPYIASFWDQRFGAKEDVHWPCIMMPMEDTSSVVHSRTQPVFLGKAWAYGFHSDSCCPNLASAMATAKRLQSGNEAFSISSPSRECSTAASTCILKTSKHWPDMKSLNWKRGCDLSASVDTSGNWLTWCEKDPLGYL